MVELLRYICKLTAEILLQFFEQLIQSHSGKLAWIVDRHPVHIAYLVQQWFEDHSQQIEIFYLPSYSP